MLAKFVSATLLVLALLVAPVPALAAGDPITEAALSSLSGKAKDVIRQAEASGDALAKAFGEQVLAIVDAMQASIKDVVADVDTKVRKQREQFFAQADSELDKILAAKQVAVTDMARITANGGDLLKALPFTDQRPEVFLSQPRVVMANGPDQVLVHIIGPKLGNSQPQASFAGQPVRLDIATDTELIAVLDREALKFNQAKPQTVFLDLTLGAPKKWYAFWGKSTEIKRQITLTLLPKTLATYAISTTITQQVTEKSKWNASVPSTGKDGVANEPVKISAADKKDGWRFDTAAIKKKPLIASRSGGDSSVSCGGVNLGSLSDTGFTFQVTHGHRTGSLGKKSPDSATCAVSVPLVRQSSKIVDGPPLNGVVTFTDDKREIFPPGLADYELSLKLFDGTSHILSKDTVPPYAAVKIKHEDNWIQFEPQPPGDL